MNEVAELEKELKMLIEGLKNLLTDIPYTIVDEGDEENEENEENKVISDNIEDDEDEYYD